MYLLIKPNGEVLRSESLENEEITSYVRQDFVVIEVRRWLTGEPIRAVVFDEDANSHEVRDA